MGFPVLSFLWQWPWCLKKSSGRLQVSYGVRLWRVVVFCGFFFRRTYLGGRRGIADPAFDSDDQNWKLISINFWLKSKSWHPYKLGIFVNVRRLFCLLFQNDVLAVFSLHVITGARCTTFKEYACTKLPVTWVGVQPLLTEMAELSISGSGFPRGYNRMGRQLVLLVKHEQAALWQGCHQQSA